MEERPILTIKYILIIGESGVGKSSLLYRLTDDAFDPEMASDKGVEFKVKVMNQQENKVKLVIWDAPGQVRFRPHLSDMYRGAKGAILVYDVSSRESFTKLEDWLKDLEDHSTNPDLIVKMLVGNKCDKERMVSREEGEKCVRKYNMMFIEASAKTKEGVMSVFEEELVHKILESPGLREAQDNRGAISVAGGGGGGEGRGACGGYCS